MPASHEHTLHEIEAALNHQNCRFEAFVEAFSQLPSDMHIDVAPALLRNLEEATNALPNPRSRVCTPLGALRA